jgi:hypothetical protein
MQDLKTGYLWGASPKAQFQGQVRCFSPPLSSIERETKLTLLQRCRLSDLSLPSSSLLASTASTEAFTSFPVPPSPFRPPRSGSSSSLSSFPLSFPPSFLIFLLFHRLNLARLVNNGQLPPRSQEAMLFFGGVFVVLATLKAVGKVKAAENEEGKRTWGWTAWIPSGCVLSFPSFNLFLLSRFFFYEAKQKTDLLTTKP